MLNNKTDLLVIIDMNNGFVNEGALSSVNVKNLVPKMKKFVLECINNHVEIIHYCDSHNIDSKEFEVYPQHCIENTWESEVIDELNFKEIEVIKKNSTNGFLTKNPFDYKKNIYIIGCVSDICVYQFALTSQKFVEEFNLDYSVNVISDLVATFDANNHNAIKVHNSSMESLKLNGVNIIYLDK